MYTERLLMQDTPPPCTTVSLKAAAALHCALHDAGKAPVEVPYSCFPFWLVPVSSCDSLYSHAGAFESLLGPAVLPIFSCQQPYCLSLHVQVRACALICNLLPDTIHHQRMHGK